MRTPHKYARRFWATMMKSLRDANQQAATAFRNWAGDCECAVATACSGSESPVISLDALAAEVPPFNYQHVFSCEHNPAKHEFIADIFAPKCLFLDAKELGSSKARDSCSTSKDGRSKVPDDAKVLVVGFPCTDISTASKNRDKTACKKLSPSKATGSVFWALKRYIDKNGKNLEAIILENVVGMLTPWKTIKKKKQKRMKTQVKRIKKNRKPAHMRKKLAGKNVVVEVDDLEKPSRRVRGKRPFEHVSLNISDILPQDHTDRAPLQPASQPASQPKVVKTKKLNISDILPQNHKTKRHTFPDLPKIPIII